uniref:Uncharacterized protein n=2 Tax=Meloidogyne TaxID=189290 RepID=A0A6V7X1X7_MELEN|nr:unnamed protein product [Meloidogyne enterolobii]
MYEIRLYYSKITKYTFQALSFLLFYLSAIHCHIIFFIGKCPLKENRIHFSEQLAIFVSCIVIAGSFCWLFANYKNIENTFLINYNFLEMPTAVLCSLLTGICGVVEIHYNINYSHTYNWTERWALITVDSALLVLLHAGMAFALT